MGDEVADVAVVGGGPAGLGAAIACARRGLSVVLLERGAYPLDKACGEGLLPPGVRALEALGVAMAPRECFPLRALRFVQEDGSVAEATLPDGGGLGVRRTALSAALLRTAQTAGVAVRAQTKVKRHRRTPEAVVLDTDGGELRARLVIAADGLASPIREAEGLSIALSPRAPRRFGATRHYALAPWSDAVEVHLAEGVEAYATPVGPQEVGVAVLWADDQREAQQSHDKLLARFPRLAERLAGAHAAPARGAGPLERKVKARRTDRLLLLGDAAGYHDAISGEGISLALMAAVALGEVAPGAIQHGARASDFAAFDQRCERRFRHYRLVSAAMLGIARRPKLRKRVLALLGRSPRAFERLVHWGLVR